MKVLSSCDLEAVKGMYQHAQIKNAYLNGDGTYNLYLSFGCGCDEYRVTNEQLNYIRQ